MKVKVIITALLVLSIIFATSCGLMEDKGSYNMGKDSITSIKGAIGEMGARKMTGINTSTSNGEQKNIYTYKTDPNDGEQAANDIAVYFQYLINNDDFISLVTFDGLPYEGNTDFDLQFAKYSVDEGKIIVLDIVYDEKGYTLTFTKFDGTLDAVE